MVEQQPTDVAEFEAVDASAFVAVVVQDSVVVKADQLTQLVGGARRDDLDLDLDPVVVGVVVMVFVLRGRLGTGTDRVSTCIEGVAETCCCKDCCDWFRES